MRAQRSNPVSFCAETLDCFAALAMTPVVNSALVGWAKRSVPTDALNHKQTVGTALCAFAHPTTISQ
ncbi:hypothetical protein C7U65_29150 [Bradyrhizobium sp. WBAH23]|nr:hypothetical protein [Bradyrhizobium sp. WBAH30]MDD1544009.1 hypothetical protein [Bradyrhizobium sp. WBAH41]MDD1559639.1 hypothetical protein [Bradyrhizobium sp. WBAH23]MDD1567275.1 hypothetical protein [Bradyrhizobium sp. WBAH33]NRB88967.1 hypothetical protein [Bradyrhizobium sp. WBAH10]